jgi:hypothetical protein
MTRIEILERLEARRDAHKPRHTRPICKPRYDDIYREVEDERPLRRRAPSGDAPECP